MLLHEIKVGHSESGPIKVYYFREIRSSSSANDAEMQRRSTLPGANMRLHG